MARHYLDHAATSPLRPEVAAALAEWATSGLHADPGRPYLEGRASSAQLEAARAELAALLGVPERRVVFTSGGTEAANWANIAARARDARAPIVLAGVEHSAVRLSAEASGPTHLLPVDRTGRIEIDALVDLLQSGVRPALVHCQAANHEVGTTQPTAEVIAVCHEVGVPVHVDACAVFGHEPLDVDELGADLVSISAHKAGGPPGIGALVVSPGLRPTPLLRGGDQERARRAGMENLPGIVGFGALSSVLSTPGTMAAEQETTRMLRDRVEHAALELEGVVAYGSREHRVAHLACFGISDVEAEPVLLGLDQREIAVHSGSACSSEALEPSPVLEAMGVDADHSLRCSFGWSSTEDDAAVFEAALPAVLSYLRSLRD